MADFLESTESFSIGYMEVGSTQLSCKQLRIDTATPWWPLGHQVHLARSDWTLANERSTNCDGEWTGWGKWSTGTRPLHSSAWTSFAVTSTGSRFALTWNGKTLRKLMIMIQTSPRSLLTVIRVLSVLWQKTKSLCVLMSTFKILQPSTFFNLKLS